MNHEPPVDILQNLRELFTFLATGFLSIFPSIVIGILAILLFVLGLLVFLLSGTVPNIGL